MFHIKEIKSFMNGILDKKQKEILPLWVDTKNQPLREVIIVNDVRVSTNKKRILHAQPKQIEIRVISSSSYPTN